MCFSSVIGGRTVSLGRSRIIAAQAVVVGVLMVVVFLTLLRPDADNQLFSIEAPGETEIAQPPDRQLREQAGRDRRDRRDSRRGGRDAPPGRVLGAGAGGTSAAPGVPAPPPARSPPRAARAARARRPRAPAGERRDPPTTSTPTPSLA